MFDEFGMVSDAAQDQFSSLAYEYFAIPYKAAWSVGVNFKGGRNDVVCIGATEVTLTSHVYSALFLNDGDLNLRPAAFASKFFMPTIKAMSQSFEREVSEASYVAVRAPALPYIGQSVYGGGTVQLGRVAIRWLIDYDPQQLGERFVADMYLGVK